MFYYFFLEHFAVPTNNVHACMLLRTSVTVPQRYSLQCKCASVRSAFYAHTLHPLFPQVGERFRTICANNRRNFKIGLFTPFRVFVFLPNYALPFSLFFKSLLENIYIF